MNIKIYMERIIGLLILLTSLNSCLSVAKMSDFSKTASTIDFDKYSTEYHEKKEPFWSGQTSNEYYFEKGQTITEKKLTDIIQYALKQKGYSIKGIDNENDYVIGKRGMYANEWSSITGVYYKLDNNQERLQIYINTKITQDFTGGWGENRAKKVGQIIEKLIDTNK